MSLKCGIVGLPNVGKSTLFNALTNAQIQAENYPFCTIEPNQGIVEVPDNRLEELVKIVNPEKVIPASVEFVDIAGLVEGAPSTKPAISTNSTLAGMTFSGLTIFTNSSSLLSGTSTIP